MQTLKSSQLQFLLSTIALFTGLLMAWPKVAIANPTTPHWTYGGTENPTQWGHHFETCAIGRDQSPIDIDASDAVEVSTSTISFDYIPVPLSVTNNGHSIQVNTPAGGSVTINGDTYSLLQFHFHTPSEHTIEGKAAPMELHLVHQNQAGELAVVGVMINAGDAHPTIASIWEHIPAEEGSNAVEGMTINAGDLLPSDTAFYSYSGSLTTPPCSEQVRWNVLATPITASEEQIEAFGHWYPVNARPVQATNGRVVEINR